MVHTEIDNIFTAHLYKWTRLPGWRVNDSKRKPLQEGTLHESGTISPFTSPPLAVYK
jgi:hypothetical protein